MNQIIPTLLAAILALPAAACLAGRQAEDFNLERWQRLHEINEQHQQKARQKRMERELRRQTKLVEKINNAKQPRIFQHPKPLPLHPKQRRGRH